MIIYGYKYAPLKLQPAPGAACPDCGKSNLLIGTQHGYAHIYWIPLLPLKRKQAGVCQECKKQFDSKAIKELAARPGTGAMVPPVEPLRAKYFLLSAMIAVALVAFGYNDVNQHNALIAAISAPQPGDRGVVKLAQPVIQNGRRYIYTAFRIHSVEDSKVKVAFSDYLFTDPSGAQKLIATPPPDAFKDELQELTKQELLVMASSGQISDLLHPAK